MNKRQTQVIAGILGTFLFLDLLVWTLPSPRTCIEESKKAEANDPDNKQNAYGPVAVIYCAGQMINDGGVLVTALATVAIAWFTLSLRDVSREQGRITDAQLSLAREEFTAEHRPWVKASVIPTGDLRFTDRLGTVDLTVIATNVGRGPAFRVIAHPIQHLILPGFTGNQLREVLAAARQMHARTGVGITLFRDDPTRFDAPYTVTFADFRIRQVDGADVAFFPAEFFVSITYEFGNPREIHQTAFICRLWGPDTTFFPRTAEGVPLDQLRVELLALNSYAD
jgi:hypothetical protein